MTAAHKDSLAALPKCLDAIKEHYCIINYIIQFTFKNNVSL